MKPAFRATCVPAILLASITWLATVVVGARATLAEPTADESKSFKSKVLLDHLDNPCGITLRPPNSSELFVAESGAGRVLCVRLNDPPDSRVAIDGFPRALLGTEPKYSLGPLALAFVNRNRTTLVVAEGGEPKGADAVRVYELPDDDKTLAFDKAKLTLRVAATGKSAAGEGDFFGVAAASTTLFAASSSDDATGWIFKCDTGGVTPVLNRFIATKRETGASAPRAIAVSNRGELVVAQAGEFGPKRDSVLCFYQAASGKRLLKLDTGLHDIAGLAYSKSGLLYAIDFSAADPSAGGLFRIDMDVRGGRQAIKAVKLLPLDRPAGLAIASDRESRELYVTTFGGGDESKGGKMGRLLKIEKTDGNL